MQISYEMVSNAHVRQLTERSERVRYRVEHERRNSIPTNLVPRVFSLSNMAAAGEKTLAHSELKRSLIGAFCCAFIRALSLVYSFQNKDGYPLRAS